MKNDRKLTIVLAAGGTGGHIFPAQALGEELVARGHKAILVTDERREQYKFAEDNNIDVHVVGIKSPARGKLKAILSILTSTTQAVKLLKRIKPNVVVGFGGYPSLPTVLAAYLLKIRIVIHEQNSVMGRVNRRLASVADRVATSFEKVSHVEEKDRKKIVLTGNPVRPNIRALRDIPYSALEKDEHLHILVTGGSQGASVFSEVVPAAIVSLPDEIKSRIRIDQQCRKEDIENVRKLYSDAGVNADLATFFNDIPARLASAHLLICRSGASTVAEMTVAGRPAVFVPYIHATDDHQTSNANALVEKNAAFLMSQKIIRADLISEYIKDFLQRPDVLSTIAINAFELGIPDADKRLADVVCDIVS